MVDMLAQDFGMFLPRLAFATVCGAAIGWERELREKGAGLRTHMMIAVGACLFIVVAISASKELAAGDLMRVIQGLVTGIGFIGAGLIFTRRGSVHGLTTAAGVWCTAGIGGAAGLGRYVLAGIATLLAVAIIGGLKHIEPKLHKAVEQRRRDRQRPRDDAP
jgi:putative Mg2+ transporter-C (MgtC) family protein